MADLGGAIVEAILIAEGRKGFLSRLSDPFWFQAFGAVLGMDWHSSGITTSVVGALKRGLGSRADELGIWVCGGRGGQSRKTPDELLRVADRNGFDGESLVRTSKLVAKVDNTAVQDGFSLYLHGFVITSDGDWVVVQQGMNGARGEARRYHWHSSNVESFVEEPHEAVVGRSQGVIVNMTDRRARAARIVTRDLVGQGPDRVVREYTDLLRHLTMPAHHEVRQRDVFLRRLHGVIALAGEQENPEFEDVLLTPGLGPRTMQALALVAEVVGGAPSRFDDPARFAFAHGGKDGHPHPVPLAVYDKTIGALRDALGRAKVGNSEKIKAFQRLDRRARQLERYASGPGFEEIVDEEWEKSPSYGGMTVLGPAGPEVEKQLRPRKRKSARSNNAEKKDKQLRLFG